MALDPKSILLSERVALVTGAAVGIGEAIALALARFGADVAICDRDAENLASTAREIEAAGRQTCAVFWMYETPTPCAALSSRWRLPSVAWTSS